MKRLTLFFTFVFSTLLSLYAEGYFPQGKEIVCFNGTNRYTRALYGTHTAFRLETSDRPVFATYRKGDCRNIQFSLVYAGKAHPLDSINDCTAYYQGGIRRYHIVSANIDLTITTTASMSYEGALWRFEISKLPKDSYFKAILSHCRSSKFSRGGDLGVDDLTKFESDSKPISTVTWKAKGTTYIRMYEDNIESINGKDAFETNLTAIHTLTSRVTFSTPDPFFNPLGNVLMAATDGLWDGLDDEQGTGTWQHGCIGWRTPLAGWRGCYVGDAVGWFDRSYHHFKAYANSQVTNVAPTIPHPSQDSTQALSRAEKRWGTQMYSDGYICRYPNRTNTMTHYDMNLNYIDGLLWHLSYDADTTQLREFWPVLKRHLEWEKRNFDPDNDHLYDAYCCIWASDALYYNSGAVTHSSAYNYKGNRYAARIAEILNEPQSVIDHYSNEADSILAAMNTRLWMPEAGHWAEFQDFMGLKRLHPSAAIWSIYTPIDCGACTPEQAWQATEYVTQEIPHIPIKTSIQTPTPLYTISTSDWMPYDWSTNNVAHEEVANMALAYFQAGRGDEGFDLLKSDIIDEMYLGRSPGNFGQISRYDAMRNEAYRDFGDNIGITSRAIINGLFGIHPDALNGRCYIQPAFPDSWDSASIHTPYLSYEYKKIGDRDSFLVEQHFPQHLEIIILPKYRGAFASSNLPIKISNSITKDEVDSFGLADITPNSEQRQQMIDISKGYNANVDDIFRNKYLTPRSPYTTLELPVQGIGQWCHPEKTAEIEDNGLRAIISDDNVFDTKQGLKFRLPKQGHNIIYTSLWDNYPDSADVSLPKGSYANAYLMMAGSTNNMQSRIDNALVIATYTDGTRDTLHIYNPINWAPINEDYYVDDYAFRLSDSNCSSTIRPLRVRLDNGLVSRTINGTESNGGDIHHGAATILKMPLNASRILSSLRLRTLSNDVVIGLMAVTLEK